MIAGGIVVAPCRAAYLAAGAVEPGADLFAGYGILQVADFAVFFQNPGAVFKLYYLYRWWGGDGGC